MKYKVGDRVRIKSIDWYNKNKDGNGNISINELYTFNSANKHFCGTIITIKSNNGRAYEVEENDAFWTDEMIEGLVEEMDSVHFKSNIRYNKISINTENCSDEVEINISNDYELVEKEGKWFAIKKKKEYPKTYEECCAELNNYPFENGADGYKFELLSTFQNLIICRDAYWKIAGEEMGLGKPWEPDWLDDTLKPCIGTASNEIIKCTSYSDNTFLAFPTAEMRDAFYENFKSEIESCKELL